MNTNFLQAALVDLVTDRVITNSTNGDKSKQAARAAEIAAVVSALAALNSGNTVGGLASLQSALQTTALNPGEAMAFNNFTSWLATQLTLLAQVPGGTLLSAVNSAILKNIGDEILAVCAKYPATVQPVVGAAT